MDEEQEDLIPVEFMQDDAAVSRSDCRCEAGGHRGHAHHEAAPSSGTCSRMMCIASGRAIPVPTPCSGRPADHSSQLHLKNSHLASQACRRSSSPGARGLTARLHTLHNWVTTLSHMLSEEFHLVLIALFCGFVLLVHQEDVRLRVVLVAV